MSRLLQTRSDDGKPSWTAHGRRPGNYAVRYRGADGNPIHFLRAAGPKLFLEIVEPKHRIELTGIRSGHGITDAKLLELLGIVEVLDAWCEELPCKLVVVAGGETVASNEATIRAPVVPWTKPLDPELFAQDNSIRYCSEKWQTAAGEERESFVGRDLTLYGGRYRCFSYKRVLETDHRLRGFACIGFVAVIRGVKHDPNITGASPDLLRHLKGRPFDVPPRMTEGRRFQKHEQWVEIGPLALRDYLLSAEGRMGDYYIWRPGHAGLIRNGTIYECKPSGRGFTNTTYTDGRGSSVRRFEPGEFTDLLSSFKPFFVSRLP